MTAYFSDPWLTIHEGDCRTVLRSLPAESVHTVVTSPPYWGLRSYGIGADNGELGLEETPEAYVAALVDVFREVRRVLRSDGTVWLNLGDTFAASRSYQVTDNKHIDVGNTRASSVPLGLKPKDLVGIPWRVAFALQQPYYTGAIPDERDRTWLAALVDGEGTFTILSTTSPHGSGNSYPPIVQVRMTSAGVVGKAASLVGVASPAQYPPSNGGNRAIYQWRLSGRRAADVARELYPYLIEKRRQAMVVWNHQLVRDSYETKRGVTIPAAAVEKQLLCRDLIRRMNRGEHVDLPSWMAEPLGMTEPGWYLRSDVIWSKPNPMPESVTDRPTKSHEYLFLLSKSARYFFDAEAVKETPHSGPSDLRKMAEQLPRIGGKTLTATDPLYMANQTTNIGKKRGVGDPSGRNIRSVWTIATAPYPGAHFATFPPKLVEPCIKAGCPDKVCGECGAPWERVVERGELVKDDGSPARLVDPIKRDGSLSAWSRPGGKVETVVPNAHRVTTTLGFRPTCLHDAPTVPGVVLDPFAGTGTVGLVAQRLSRRAVLIDLNAEYLAQCLARNAQTPLGLESA